MINNYYSFIPVLSDNLDYNRLTENEYILSNANHKHYLKINKDVYNLLNLIDGVKNLKEISIEYQLKYSKSISVEEIQILLFERLSIFGILKGFDEKIKKYKSPSYLKLGFIIINEKILSKIVKNFYFLFKKRVAFFVILISITFISTILYFNFDLYKSFNLQKSLLYYLIITILSVTFHEIGHATSASYFGAKHGGVGFGFYLFTPVFYADVTDIWRLSKNKRIIVNISGIYFEVVFCSIMTLIGCILNNHALLIIMIIVCLKTLFNLNPFFRSDGYWVLSDLTNKPNLFYHSSEKIKNIFVFFFKRRKFTWTIIDFILLLYGLISFSFIGLFLYYILFKNFQSILYFPKNLYSFINNLFNNHSEISLTKYGELIVPFIFFLLVFNLLKSVIVKYYKRNLTKFINVNENKH